MFVDLNIIKQDSDKLYVGLNFDCEMVVVRNVNHDKRIQYVPKKYYNIYIHYIWLNIYHIWLNIYIYNVYYIINNIKNIL